jgi:hypothetical protein
MLAVKACEAEGATIADVGEMVKINTLTVAVALNDGFEELATVMVWFPLAAGAVYCPVVEISPTVKFPPTVPSTDQVRAGFDAPGTLTVNCCGVDAITVAVEGLTEIVETTTDALAVADVSAVLVAVTVCEPVVGGEVYAPAVVIMPTVALPPPTLSTDQDTAVFENP